MRNAWSSMQNAMQKNFTVNGQPVLCLIDKDLAHLPYFRISNVKAYCPPERFRTIHKCKKKFCFFLGSDLTWSLPAQLMSFPAVFSLLGFFKIFFSHGKVKAFIHDQSDCETLTLISWLVSSSIYVWLKSIIELSCVFFFFLNPLSAKPSKCYPEWKPVCPV